MKEPGHLAWLIPAAVGIIVGLSAFTLVGAGGGERAEPNTPGGPSWRRDPAPAELRDKATTETHPAVEQARRDLAADRSQPRFTGDLGGFSIVGSEPLNNYSCGASRSSERNRPIGSELDPGDRLRNVESVRCGTSVYGVSGEGRAPSGASATVLRNYYQGEVPRIPIEAPRDRLKTLTIAGKRAVLELPPQQLFGECRLFVIERASAAAAPGIIWEISGSLSCDDAVALAEALLGGSS
ncbi:MAG: hypothetical protein WEB00_14080 [Dehalococcoidia bacterium]